MSFVDEALLRRIPKAELHVHLRGAIPPEVLETLLSRHAGGEFRRYVPARHLALFERYDNIRPLLDGGPHGLRRARELFRYRDFDHFLAAYCFTGYLVRSSYDLRALIEGVLASLVAEGIVYAEITVSLIEYIWQGLSVEQVLSALSAAHAHPGIRVQWIIDLVRDTGPASALGLLGQILAFRPEGLVGITLGGSEHRFPPAPFAELYDLARTHGLRRTVHAGEALGPESVWDALRLLGVERVGHGVRAVEDPALVAYLAREHVPLEVCLTSNLSTGMYRSYAAHPLPRLLEAGVPITLNTDDPTFFDTTLSRELLHAAELGIGPEPLLGIVENGFAHAFIPTAEASAYRSEVRRQWARLVGPL